MSGDMVKVLIVDDRPENLLAMSSILQSPDYGIVTADSGEEALRRVLQEEFAMILMDVQMPGMNGFETVQLIKSREQSNKIPIIFVTALSQATEYVLKGYEVGAIDFLFKPVHPATLKHKVEQFVQMFKDRQQLKAQKELIGKRTKELEEVNQRLLQTTQELKRTEALARVVGEAAVDSFITIDDRGCIIAVNPALRGMFAYEPKELIGRPVWLLLPDMRHEYSASMAYATAVKPSLAVKTEQVAVRRDGSTFPAEVQSGSTFVGNQSIYVLSVRDISERKLQYMRLEQAVEERTWELVVAKERLEEEMRERSRMAEELRQSYERINDILESITDAFYSLDKNWNVTYMNKSAERQLGIERDKMLNQSFWNWVPKSLTRSYELLRKAMVHRIPIRREFYSLITNTWIELKVFPSPQGISIYVADTTEIHDMQRNVRHSQERFYAVFKASPSLMAIQSLSDHSYLDVNESWLRHTGYTYDEMLSGKVDLCLALESRETDGRIPLKGSEETVTDMKVRYTTQSGEVRIGLLSTEVIEVHNDPCMLTVITDITDRVELERELHRLDRLHMIGEMAAGIAHEIRNPMTTVRGFLQLMRAKSNKPSDEIIDVMVEELNRANSIISEFLALAKNRSNDLKRQCLSGIIEAIVPLIQAEATLSGKSIETRLEPGMELSLDEKEIRQMVLNLALNGLEAMKEGGVVRISTFKSAGECILEVSDQGPGLSQEAQEKLGTPFFTTKETGTGLGLAVCFSIAARHGAKLNCRTGPEGTVFSVHFARRPCVSGEEKRLPSVTSNLAGSN